MSSMPFLGHEMSSIWAKRALVVKTFLEESESRVRTQQKVQIVLNRDRHDVISDDRSFLK